MENPKKCGPPTHPVTESVRTMHPVTESLESDGQTPAIFSPGGGNPVNPKSQPPGSSDAALPANLISENVEQTQHAVFQGTNPGPSPCAPPQNPCQENDDVGEHQNPTYQSKTQKQGDSPIDPQPAFHTRAGGARQPDTPPPTQEPSQTPHPQQCAGTASNESSGHQPDKGMTPQPMPSAKSPSQHGAEPILDLSQMNLQDAMDLESSENPKPKPTQFCPSQPTQQTDEVSEATKEDLSKSKTIHIDRSQLEVEEEASGERTDAQSEVTATKPTNPPTTNKTTPKSNKKPTIAPLLPVPPTEKVTPMCPPNTPGPPGAGSGSERNACTVPPTQTPPMSQLAKELLNATRGADLWKRVSELEKEFQQGKDTTYSDYRCGNTWDIELLENTVEVWTEELFAEFEQSFQQSCSGSPAPAVLLRQQQYGRRHQASRAH